VEPGQGRAGACENFHRRLGQVRRRRGGTGGAWAEEDEVVDVDEGPLEALGGESGLVFRCCLMKAADTSFDFASSSGMPSWIATDLAVAAGQASMTPSERMVGSRESMRDWMSSSPM